MGSPNDSPAESKAETSNLEMALTMRNNTSSPLNEGNLNSIRLPSCEIPFAIKHASCKMR